MSLVDLPGTYSLRGRSPDEEITRDIVLGRTPGEALPDLVLCVADSTNLRLTIRLVLELKSTGRPLMLVLNMFDIATRRGVTVDVPRLSEALGVPVVTSIAVRKGGTVELLRRTDEIIAAQTPVPPQPNLWQPLSSAVALPSASRPSSRRPSPLPLLIRPRARRPMLHPAGLAILALIHRDVPAVFMAQLHGASHGFGRSGNWSMTPARGLEASSNGVIGVSASSCSCRRSSSSSCSSCCWKISLHARRFLMDRIWAAPPARPRLHSAAVEFRRAILASWRRGSTAARPADHHPDRC